MYLSFVHKKKKKKMLYLEKVRVHFFINFQLINVSIKKLIQSYTGELLWIQASLKKLCMVTLSMLKVNSKVSLTHTPKKKKKTFLIFSFPLQISIFPLLLKAKDLTWIKCFNILNPTPPNSPNLSSRNHLNFQLIHYF